MSQQSHNHPSRERLQAFASGALRDEQIAEVKAHLDACETCLRALETLPEDPVVLMLRRSASEASGVARPERAWPPEPGDYALRKAHGVPRAASEASVGAGERASQASGALEAALPEALLSHPRYRVIRPAGSGGMGVVVLAEQVYLHRNVALKVIRPDLLQSPKAVDRFRTEVRAAGRLSHPNVVTTYDADQAGQTWFLVTEWVDGTPLSEVVADRGPLPVPLACHCAHQAALGLEHAHQRGLIHRDIKPQNLLLTPEGTLKILDFGLARFVAEWDPAGSLTDFGTGLGTPDYMAPEQARNARAADIRADIYSLGCTLYFLLAGRAPFPEGTAAEKVAGHLERSPTPLGELRTDLPAGLEAVVERMMAKDPAGRFQTPAEAAQALEPFLAAPATRPVTVPPQRAWPAAAVTPAKRPRQQWLLLAGLAALAALALGLATAGLFWTLQGRWIPPPESGPAAGTTGTEMGTQQDRGAGAPRQIGVLGAHADLVSSLAVSPDGRFLASAGYDNKVQLWQLPDFRDAGLFAHHSPVYFVRFSPEGDRLVFGSRTSLVVADPVAGRVLRELRIPQEDFSAAAFLPGQRLVSADQGGTVRQWGLDTGQPLHEFQTDRVTFAAFSRDGRYLLFSGGGVRVRFCDVQAGKTLLTLEGHTGQVRCVALSSKAERALTGGDDKTVRLWDLATGEELHRFTGHTGTVRCVAFSPDDARALSGGADGTLRLWDLVHKCELLRLEGHQGTVWSVAFLPDGTRALSGGQDGTVRLWDVSQEEK